MRDLCEVVCVVVDILVFGLLLHGGGDVGANSVAQVNRGTAVHWKITVPCGDEELIRSGCLIVRIDATSMTVGAFRSTATSECRSLLLRCYDESVHARGIFLEDGDKADSNQFMRGIVEYCVESGRDLYCRHATGNIEPNENFVVEQLAVSVPRK